MVYEVRERTHSKGQIPKAIEYEITCSGCWECTSHYADSSGYRQIIVDGVHTRVHRYVYEKEYGPIPEGLVVRHTCDNPACINPQHLLIGTQQDNMHDAVKRNRFHSNPMAVEEGFNDELDTTQIPWRIK